MLTAPEVRKNSTVRDFSGPSTRYLLFCNTLNLNTLFLLLPPAIIGNPFALYPVEIDCGKVSRVGLPRSFPHEREIQSDSSAGWCNSGFQLGLPHQKLCQEA